MNSSWLRSSLLVLALPLAGCFPDLSGVAIAIDELFQCSWSGGTSGFPVTEGTGDVHGTLFVEASPAVVARGAAVRAVIVVPGEQRKAAARGEGEVVVESSSAQICKPVESDEEAGGGGFGGHGGGWGEPGEPTTQVDVFLRAHGAGSVVVSDGGEQLVRWTLDVRDAVSVEIVDESLRVIEDDQPAICFLGEQCVVRARVLDADGVGLYAEHDFSWSLLEGDLELGTLHGALYTWPEQPGTFRVRAEVLGLSRDFDVEVQ